MPQYLRRWLPLMGFGGLAGCNMPNPTNSSVHLVQDSTVAGPIPVPSGDYHMPIELTSPPVPIYQVPPIYPYEYKANGIQGQALVRFVVEEDGTVHQAQVVSATRDGFGFSAVQSILRWRFRPGQMSRQPVRVLLQAPVNFKLGEY